jgi:cytochrome c oxidase subunit IV
MNQENTSEVVVQPVDKAKVNGILKVALILGVITALEFLIAFTVPHEFAALRVIVFVGMTIVKAFYIVAEFMHLGHEAKVLIWSIMIPLIFVVWLIAALLIQGGAIFDVLYQ